jgi:isopentenyl-diphosphate delta-isomerase type 1
MNTYSTDAEILEVVDERDTVVGSATRRAIHEKGLLHRAVHIFVFNSAGDLYVQRRAPNKDRFPNRLASSASGHVDPGETYLESAVRELEEELGIRAELEEVLRLSEFEVTDNEHVVLFTTVSDSNPIPNPEEITWGAFMTGERLSQLMERNPDDFVPAFVRLWKEFLRVTA